MSILCEDIIQVILSSVAPRDLYNCYQVCRTWRNIMNNMKYVLYSQYVYPVQPVTLRKQLPELTLSNLFQDLQVMYPLRNDKHLTSLHVLYAIRSDVSEDEFPHLLYELSEDQHPEILLEICVLAWKKEYTRLLRLIFHACKAGCYIEYLCKVLLENLCVRVSYRYPNDDEIDDIIEELQSSFTKIHWNSVDDFLTIAAHRKMQTDMDDFINGLRATHVNHDISNRYRVGYITRMYATEETTLRILNKFYLSENVSELPPVRVHDIIADILFLDDDDELCKRINVEDTNHVSALLIHRPECCIKVGVTTNNPARMSEVNPYFARVLVK